MNAPTTNAPRQYEYLRSQLKLNFPSAAKISMSVVPARKKREPPTKSGGIFVTAIFIPKYVLPQMTYTNPKQVIVMATCDEDFEFTCKPRKIMPFWRALGWIGQVYARARSF